MNDAKIITGKKWSAGKYNLKRKFLTDSNKIVILEIKNGHSKLSEKVNHIHYDTSTAIIWFEGSRLGLLYEIIPDLFST